MMGRIGWDDDLAYMLDKWREEEEEEQDEDDWPEDYGCIPPPWQEMW